MGQTSIQHSTCLESLAGNDPSRDLCLNLGANLFGGRRGSRCHARAVDGGKLACVGPSAKDGDVTSMFSPMAKQFAIQNIST